MPKLADYVGQTILIRSLVIKEDAPAVVKLVSLDEAGIWVESQDATEHYLAQFKYASSPKTPVWFLPFAQIFWILGSENYPAISEKALGLQSP
jgi:hypothetical protein